MDVKSSQVSDNVEYYEKKLIRWLDSWRELAVGAKSFLIWEETSYAWILLASTSTIFLGIGYLEPTLLTSLCVILLLFTLFDYLAPQLSNTVFKQENWTASKQKDLEEISKSLASLIVLIHFGWSSACEAKIYRPKVFYTTTIVSLTALAWIGSVVDNLFLTYLVVLAVVMLPGLLHHGLLDKYYKVAALALAQFIRSVGTPTKQKTN